MKEGGRVGGWTQRDWRKRLGEEESELEEREGEERESGWFLGEEEGKCVVRRERGRGSRRYYTHQSRRLREIYGDVVFRLALFVLAACYSLLQAFSPLLVNFLCLLAIFSTRLSPFPPLSFSLSVFPSLL